MRIFTAVRHSINPEFYYGGLWSGNFYPALRQLGHQIVESQVDLLPASQFMQIPTNFTKQEQEVRSQITQKIVDEVRQAHLQERVDLFLSYFYNSHFEPEGFAEIHRLGIPTVNFYCNSIYQFELVAEIATKVQFSWHPEKAARSLYLQVGANPIWVQMGADPKIYHPIKSSTRQAKACFVGQRYANRNRLLATLIENQIPLDIYGSGWSSAALVKSSLQPLEQPQTEYLGRQLQQPGSLKSYAQTAWSHIKNQGIITGIQRIIKQVYYRHQSRQLAPILTTAACGFAKNISQTFAQYEVIMNLSDVWSDGFPGSKLIPHVRLRDFEAPMCRTCYLTGYTDEIAEFYQLGKEIDTYRYPDELLDKMRFYLHHLSQAEKLREAGYQRALRDHTWKRRFEQLFKQIDFKI
ncbi:MAG: glycosyltransferase [Aulosira sp. ZfuVER01]|nr:glycosyltransferase [Aulosira sp. ZfuVER01]MDZ7997748.1 glycosyltransferase [Aulosira sp. DedVER01a]MDZ8052243.1 glycosyltransferase [Aulosira sp. ZfuCHP01]